MSAALKRRFNIVILSTPVDLKTEIGIVTKRVNEMSKNIDLDVSIPDDDAITRVVTIFRELRSGISLDGKEKIKSPQNVLSTAEAISLLANSMALAGSFGDGKVKPSELASGLQGAIVKDDDKDRNAWKEYIENIIKKRTDWKDLYKACKELND